MIGRYRPVKVRFIAKAGAALLNMINKEKRGLRSTHCIPSSVDFLPFRLGQALVLHECENYARGQPGEKAAAVFWPGDQ